MDGYESWIKSLQFDLECPVCLEIPQAGLLLCLNGHHVCVPCKTEKSIEICPTCFQDFTGAKNLFLEKFIGSFGKLQESIKNIIEEEKQNVRKICDEYVAQHKKEIQQKPVQSVSTQTDTPKKGPPNKQNNKQVNHNNLKICVIGSCERRLNYTSLIYHLKKDHSNTHVMTTINMGEPFLKKFVLLQEHLPRIYDFSFFVIPMGLFFFNVTIHATGELIPRILYVNDTARKAFSCEFILTCRNIQLKSHGAIKSCNPLKEMFASHHFHIDKDKMFHMKRNAALECWLKITELPQNQRINENVIP